MILLLSGTLYKAFINFDIGLNYENTDLNTAFRNLQKK